MSLTFIAGKDAAQYDHSDWDISEIPVYFNPADIPATAPVAEIEALIRHCCTSWSLRYDKPLVYRGKTGSRWLSGAVVINFGSNAQLLQVYNSEVNGLCKYHVKYHDGVKWILDGCEIYINSDYRPFANFFMHGTILHELGHSCGIHGHNSAYGHVMSTSSAGRTKLTLEDCQMLDRWSPFAVELHNDLSLTAPIVVFGDGVARWIDLQYTGNQFSHTWKAQREVTWQAPTLPTPNVALGGIVEYGGVNCQEVHMHDVRGLDIRVHASMVYAPNGNLILTMAETFQQ